MSPLLEPLPWDSAFLGFAVARLTVPAGLPAPEAEAALREAVRAGYRLLCVEVGPASGLDELLRRAGARLVDRRATFGGSLATLPASFGSDADIHATTTLTPQLEALAWQSGEYSRFRLDPNFAPAFFERLYSHWMRHSLSGGLAWQVLVLGNPAGPVRGMLTLGERNGQAEIGLLAVDRPARGQGGGQRLLAAALASARQRGYNAIGVRTQLANAPACRLYAAAGFVLLAEQHVYHLWLG